MFERIYIEIGNICNLGCSFCQGTKKPKRQLSLEEFSTVCQKIKSHTKYIYLHVMGEPLLHPQLEGIINTAKQNNLCVCITTNGTLLKKSGDSLLSNASAIHKISISLHALESNNADSYDEYLKSCANFAKSAAQKGIFTVFRLWNENSAEGLGQNTKNEYIKSFLKNQFCGKWQPRPKGYRLAQNIFLEYDGIFTWPAQSKAQKLERGFCHALSSQLAILADGTVVPCCLDSNGDITLGNIFLNSLEEILNSPAAVSLKQGFASGKMTHPLCRKCTFARKFKIRNN